MNEKTPIAVVFLPPIISGFMLGIASAMIALGLEGDPLVWGGIGVFLGFLFSTMIWTDLLIRANKPPRTFEMQTSAIKQPPVRVQVELRREDGNYLGVD